MTSYKEIFCLRNICLFRFEVRTSLGALSTIWVNKNHGIRVVVVVERFARVNFHKKILSRILF